MSTSKKLVVCSTTTSLTNTPDTKMPKITKVLELAWVAVCVSTPILGIANIKKVQAAEFKCWDWSSQQPTVLVQHPFPDEQGPDPFSIVKCVPNNFNVKAVEVVGVYDGMTNDEFFDAKRIEVKTFNAW